MAGSHIWVSFTPQIGLFPENYEHTENLRFLGLDPPVSKVHIFNCDIIQ